MAVTDKNGFLSISFMPDGNGGLQPVPEVLTPQETIRFLRLDVDGPTKPELTLRYYREQKLLKGIRVGKNLRYTRSQLTDFLEKLQKIS